MIHIWVWWQESLTLSDPQPLRQSLSSRKPTRTHVTFPKKLPQRQILWPTSALPCLSMCILFLNIRFKTRMGVDLNQTAESLHVSKRCIKLLLPNIIYLFLCETGEQMPWESYRVLTHTQTGADVCLLFSLKDKCYMLFSVILHAPLLPFRSYCVGDKLNSLDNRTHTHWCDSPSKLLSPKYQETDAWEERIKIKLVLSLYYYWSVKWI